MKREREWIQEHEAPMSRACQECASYVAGACRVQGVVVRGATRGRACFRASKEGDKIGRVQE